MHRMNTAISFILSSLWARVDTDLHFQTHRPITSQWFNFGPPLRCMSVTDQSE